MNRFVAPVILCIISLSFIQGDKLRMSELSSETGKPELTVFDSLIFRSGISVSAFNTAFVAYSEHQKNHSFLKDSLLVIIDYSKPSGEERFFIFDIKNKSILDKSLVAHGQNSGEVSAERFSNKLQSHQSSLGLFVTANTYEGRHGYSLQIEGLEKNLNDNALKRAIVIHGASYVSYDYIEKNGRLGRSFGCPALPVEKTHQIIDQIKGGSCLYVYHHSIETLKKTESGKLQ